ncbi:MAG: T9SS type A sorting domain-containing protein, partial [Rhodothermales bacterium]
TGDGALKRQGYLGFATLRRDGFASIDGGSIEGVLKTRPLQFDYPDGYLFVNAETLDGRLRVEVLDESGRQVPGLDRYQCLPFQVDSTRFMVRWEDGESLAAVSGTPFSLRFILESGKLFSFWVSPTRDGASEGYLGAGGPAYGGYRDASPPDTSGVDVDLPRSPRTVNVAPNPVYTKTYIAYDTEVEGLVAITLYDTAGRLVRVLQNVSQSAGPHTLRFDRNDLAAGVYFCRVQTPRYSETAKLIILDRP